MYEYGERRGGGRVADGRCEVPPERQAARPRRLRAPHRHPWLVPPIGALGEVVFRVAMGSQWDGRDGR